jgi:hypothetical protein
MMNIKTLLAIFCLPLIGYHALHADRTGGDSSVVEATSDTGVYKKVYDNYSDILECFYTYERADYDKKDFHLKHMFSTIKRYVEGDLLPLYGNFFSRMWRNTTACSDSKFPLRKFDTLLVEDALGHLHKHYKNNEATLIVDLIRSLNLIRQLVRQSIDYRFEDLIQENKSLEIKLSCLKRELKEAHADCERLRSKLAVYEPKI